METKKKQYKPGQIITLNIKGVNRRYKIKRLRDPYDEDPSPACGYCEFANIPSCAPPCSTLCFQGHCFKTVEQGRVIPDNCYLLEIERKHKGGTLKTIVFPDGHRIVIRLSKRTISRHICSHCMPRNKWKPYCERKRAHIHVGEDKEEYLCHHLCGDYHYPIVVYDGNKKL